MSSLSDVAIEKAVTSSRSYVPARLARMKNGATVAALVMFLDVTGCVCGSRAPRVCQTTSGCFPTSDNACVAASIEVGSTKVYKVTKSKVVKATSPAMRV